MGLVRTVAPEVEPVTVPEGKTHCRVDHADEDTLIETLIQSARETCENRIHRSLITQTWRLTLDAFPRHLEPIELPMGPVQSVTSISYVDDDGATQTWASSDYRVDTDSIVARVTPVYNGSYPSTRDVTGAVTVTYVTGYGDAGSDVPAGIKAAMLLLVGHWYEHREQVVTGTIATVLPNTVDMLLSRYVVPVVV